MLQRLFAFLNRDLTGRTWTEEHQHPFFSKLVYFGNKQSGQSYWEAEVLHPGATESATATMIGTPRGPTEQEVAFCRWLLAEQDAIFERCRRLVAPEFKRWTKTSLPDDYRKEVKLDGFQVPGLPGFVWVD